MSLIFLRFLSCAVTLCPFAFSRFKKPSRIRTIILLSTTCLKLNFWVPYWSFTLSHHFFLTDPPSKQLTYNMSSISGQGFYWLLIGKEGLKCVFFFPLMVLSLKVLSLLLGWFLHFCTAFTPSPPSPSPLSPHPLHLLPARIINSKPSFCSLLSVKVYGKRNCLFRP